MKSRRCEGLARSRWVNFTLLALIHIWVRKFKLMQMLLKFYVITMMMMMRRKMMMAMTFSDKRIALSWSTTGCYTSKSVETHWVLKNKISDCHGGDDDNGDGDVS